MKNREINTILLANSYLIKCKTQSVSTEKMLLARRYLTTQIKKTLIKREPLTKKSHLFKVFSFFLFDFIKS